MANRVTLKQIAEEAGMSKSAVSMVLNDQPVRLSPENKKRIKEIAANHHYQVNQVARSLATNRSNALGLVIPDIGNQFFSSLAELLEDRCREAGYVLMVASSHDRSSDDRAIIEMFEARGVDGMFIVPTADPSQDEDELAKVICSLTVPYVMVDRLVEGIDCDRVRYDNVRGAELATAYLLDHGHVRIACIANESHSAIGRDRLKGYRQTMAARGCEVDPSWVIESDFHLEGGYSAADQVVATDVTAVFSCSDMVSLGLLKRFAELGIGIPGDLSLVSYDNSSALLLAAPALTAVEQNVDELGQRAFDLLMARIDHPKTPLVGCVLDPCLVEKDSVARVS